MGRGRRYDDTPKLNIKKVIATIVAIIVLIMFVISIKNLLSNPPTTKNVSTVETYFPVYTNQKWGVINQNGQEVIHTTYDEMVVVPDRYTDLFIAMVDVDYENETYRTKVLNKEGKEILTNYNQVEAIENSDGTDIWYENNILQFEQNGKYGLIDFNGKLILNAEYDRIYALDGIQKNIIIEKDGLQGLVNTSMGEVIVKPEYTEILTLGETYENGYIVKQNGKYGVISADAKIIFEPSYDEIKKVASNDYYAVVQNGKTSLINAKGETVLDLATNNLQEINGDNITAQSNGLYGIMKLDGTTLIPNEYEELKYIYGTNYIAKKAGKYGIISATGNTVLAFTYTAMNYIKTADFIQADKENYKTDLINREFKVVLEDVIVSDLNLENGYIRVRQNDEYDYYNFKFEKKTNKEMLATNTLFLVKENGKYGYENKNGDRIVDCIYDDAKEQNKFGYCAVKKDGVWGCLKSDGTVVVQPSLNLDEYLYVDFIGTWYLSKDLDLNVYTK